MNASVITPSNLITWMLGIVVFVISVLNLFLVHPVPGIVALLLSLVYLPQTDSILQKRFGFSIPVAAKIILGVVVVWFTLGVSDLGEVLGF